MKTVRHALNQEIQKDSEDFDYLNDDRRINKLKREKLRRGISPEKRDFLNKTLNSKTNIRTWSSEYREHMAYRVIYALYQPFPPKKAKLANKLGISLITLQRLIRSPEYERAKNELRRELRRKWGADIDMVVIKKALQGSKYHADLFYQLEGELIKKLEVKNVDNIPEDPKERRKVIDNYLDQLKIAR